MTILLTNDDGIYAEGIFAIYQELKKIATVLVVAPDSERSSVGHGITLSHPIWFKRVKRKDKFFGYGISGMPADCVKFGISVLLKGKKPDLVISGINLGPNDGCSVFYSGTVAGAREGALMGVPSMAVSLGTFVNPDFKYAAKFAAKFAPVVIKQKLPTGTFLSVNVPHRKAGDIKGVKVTRQGRVPIHGSFQRRADPNLREYYWMTGRPPAYRPNHAIDTYAMHAGFVTVTPIICDSTDEAVLSDMQSWKIKP